MGIVLAIDAGHGLGNKKPGVYDPGAVAGGHTEAAIALDWALTLKFIAQQRGMDTVLLRTGDNDVVPLSRRVSRAEDAGATHYLAIHCNAASNPLASGSEAYYRDAMDKRFAELALDCAVKVLARKNRGVRSESSSQHPHLAVFGFHGPAALLELGFITNPGDRSRMLNRALRVAFSELFISRLGGL